MGDDRSSRRGSGAARAARRLGGRDDPRGAQVARAGARARDVGRLRVRSHPRARGGGGRDRLRAALADFDRTAAKLDHALAQAQALADAFARGEGSIARLANDPEFPEDAKELGRILKNQPWRVVGHPVDKP